jgi:hypothetical protein
VTSRTIAALFLAGAQLAGCGPAQQVVQFTAGDAANATAMAKAAAAGGDSGATQRAGCWSSWAGLADGLAGAPNAAGIFTSVEAGIEVQNTLQTPACQVIAGQVLLWAARKAPLGNLLP